jgi:hypothetical protein
MFRKILLSTLAVLGLMSGTVATADAHPVYHHPQVYRHVQYHSWAHRAFPCWADANAWIAYQRRCGIQCYYEWHGPQCFVYYR